MLRYPGSVITVLFIWMDFNFCLGFSFDVLDCDNTTLNLYCNTLCLSQRFSVSILDFVQVWNSVFITETQAPPPIQRNNNIQCKWNILLPAKQRNNGCTETELCVSYISKCWMKSSVISVPFHSGVASQLFLNECVYSNKLTKWHQYVFRNNGPN